MKEDKVNISDYGFSILQVETIAVCNMSCKFCPYPIREQKGDLLEDKYIRSVIDELKIDDRFEYLCFSQFNEPLADERIYTMIDHAKSRGIPVMIITNGLKFCDPDVRMRLLKSAPDHIKISLHNLDEKSFMNSRSSPVSFEDYKKGIFSFIKEARGKRSIVTIDIAYNFSSNMDRLLLSLLGLEAGDPSIAATLDELKPQVCAFMEELASAEGGRAFVRSEICKHIKGLSHAYKEQEGVRLYDNISIKFKKFIYGRRLFDFFSSGKSFKCSTRILGVLANGNVVPCCLAYDDMLKLGNIKESNLAGILKMSEKFVKDIRDGVGSNRICLKCQGAPTRRGALLRTIVSKALSVIPRSDQRR